VAVVGNLRFCLRVKSETKSVTPDTAFRFNSKENYMNLVCACRLLVWVICCRVWPRVTVCMAATDVLPLCQHVKHCTYFCYIYKKGFHYFYLFIMFKFYLKWNDSVLNWALLGHTRGNLRNRHCKIILCAPINNFFNQAWTSERWCVV
jgi:hypothetical protein